jgi:hypothetical protein
MKISEESRKALVKEIRFACNKMKSSENPLDKVFFFSAIFGIIHRLFNSESDPELIFVHQVVHQAFDGINAKLNIPAPPSVATSYPTEFFPKLQGYLEELAEIIEINKPVYDVLQKIAVLGYTMTGNGLYLYMKGDIKI